MYSSTHGEKAGSNRRTKIAFGISLAVSLGILAYLFAKLDWREVFRQLRNVNAWYLPLLSLSFPLLIWLRAIRWRYLLPAPDKLSIRALSDATYIGFFASTVLPLRAGEIIRPWIASRWQPVSFSAAFVSIVIERLADAVCLLSLVALCLTQMEQVPAIVEAGAKALGILTAAILGIVLASYVLPVRMERFFHAMNGILTGRLKPGLTAKINAMITDCFAGLRVISSWRQLIAVVLMTYAIWLAAAAWYQGLLWAFGEFPSFWVGMTLNVMIALAIAAPSAPGFVGTFQVGCLVALGTIFGYADEFAIAYSVIAHVLQMVLVVAAGLLVLHLRGLSLRQMRAVNPPAS